MPSISGTIRRCAFTICLVFCLGVVFLRAQQPAPAPAGPDLTGLFNTAMVSFNKGDYDAALTSLKTVISGTEDATTTPENVAKLKQLMEPVFFTLGAAYFDKKDYAEAIPALQDYIRRYPQGNRVPEAQFSLAQAHYFNQEFEMAANAFAPLETIPKYRDDVLLLEGISFHEAKDLDKAVAALERLTKDGIRSQTTARGAMQLIAYYSEQKETDKAFKTLAEVQANIGQVENVVELNSVALTQGDAFLEAQKYEEALTCYRAVRVRAEVISLQTERLAAAQRRLAGLQSAMRANPKEAGQYYVTLRQTQDTIAEDTKLLADFQKLPSIRPKLLYRMGRAFNGMGRPWEALVVYNDCVEMSKDPTDREPALYAQVTTNADLNQTAQARKECDAYLKEFPQGPNASTVGYLLGATALQDNDPKAAETYFGRMLQEQPASNLREEMKFLLANSQFAQGEYDVAKKGYEDYLSEFPGGTHAEDANYRLALCDLFAGKYDDAITGIDAYLKKYPGGAQEPDALYRKAVCQYAFSKYDEVIKGCEDWIKKYPGDQQQGEVEALLGDSYAATDKSDQALDAYTKSYKAATTDEVLNYSIMEASKILQKRGDWEAVGSMFEEFVKNHPDHPTAVMAAYWIGRAKSKEGKPEEAKQFVAGMVKKYIDDPKKGAVEQLISQLVTLCVRKKPTAKPVEVAASPAPGASPTGSPSTDATNLVATATPTPAPEPEAPPAAAPGAELDELLGSAEQDQSPTARARILYAKALLAKLRRQNAEYDTDLLTIAQQFKPGVLSAPILGEVGDVLVARGRLDEAAPFYQHLVDYYPKSDYIDFAYNGLGEIAYQKKDYEKALGFFHDGTNKIAANLKLKDLTLGEAKTLFTLGKYDESEKMFKQVAAVKEWRGDATAMSVYYLGQIEAAQGHWAEANAYYQRVFVAYQRFLPWVAKAYIGSGESFEKLDKKPEAIKTYQEMLRNQKLTDFSETNQARERLSALGAS